MLAYMSVSEQNGTFQKVIIPLRSWRNAKVQTLHGVDSLLAGAIYGRAPPYLGEHFFLTSL
jgi:hypothetical protein